MIFHDNYQIVAWARAIKQCGGILNARHESVQAKLVIWHVCDNPRLRIMLSKVEGMQGLWTQTAALITDYGELIKCAQYHAVNRDSSYSQQKWVDYLTKCETKYKNEITFLMQSFAICHWDMFNIQ